MKQTVKLPAPLFQDPIYGAPTDPAIIWNEEESCWWILYTQRRLGHADIGVSGVHGSKIGIASSKDMTKWLYRGVLPSLDFEAGHNTFWAPEVIRAQGKYHMYVSYITGVPTDWNYERHIAHYSADNLWNWNYEGIVPLSSDRVIDACVYEVSPGTFKMWYKDEEHQSHSFAAISKDLYTWTVTGEEITDCGHEGPNVFELAGYKWMITDCWDGLGVYRSDDFCHWTRQEGNLLKEPGTREADNEKGHHADVLVSGERACIVYFVHYNNREASLSFLRGATVLQTAELRVRNGMLCCDRNKGYEISPQSFDIRREDLWKGAVITSEKDKTVSISVPAAGGGILMPWLLNCAERYFSFDIESLEDHSVSLELLFHLKDDSRKGGQETVHGLRFGIMPHFPVQIIIDLRWIDGQVLFPEHEAGQLKTVWMGGRIEKNDVEKISLEVRPCYHDQRLEFSDLRLTDERPGHRPLCNVKLIDELGQLKTKNWPEKTGCIAELKDKFKAYTNLPDAYGIPGWNRYGGWTERKLSPGSNFFSRVKKDGRWYLTDPEGFLFFSVGPDCVQVTPDCRIDGLESVMDWLPARDDPVYGSMYRDMAWPEFYPERRRNCRVFSFINANLYRAFGEEWHEKWGPLISRQLKNTGLNTIANWSDPALFGKAGMPYVINLERFPETKQFIFRDFPDVFSDEYVEEAERCARYLLPYRDDPLMIGYFLRNEPMWAFVNNLIIADEVLRNPALTACKEKLLEFLQKKYGSVNNLSQAWEHKFDSFHDLRKPVENASKLSKAASADLREFSRIMLDAYVSIPSKACRGIDSHHMNLGMRWAWISDPDIVTGWENFDVFSINCYDEDPTAALENIRNLGVDLPILIGEFHFGALDLGLTATGLKATANQRERGKAYRYYCERVAAHPFGVGCHWFQCFDQFPLGRFDGENYNIGLFDVCNLPNKEMMDAIRNCGMTLYQVVEGSLPPVENKPKYIPMIAY